MPAQRRVWQLRHRVHAGSCGVGLGEDHHTSLTTTGPRTRVDINSSDTIGRSSQIGTMSSSQPVASRWMSYTLDNRHERRAALVCTVCHAKKVKCDLQAQQQNGSLQCSFCSKSGRECQVRSPKRRKRTSEAPQSTSSRPTLDRDAATQLKTRENNVILPITPPRSHHELLGQSPQNLSNTNAANTAPGRDARAAQPDAEYGSRYSQSFAGQPGSTTGSAWSIHDNRRCSQTTGAHHIATGCSDPSEGLKSDVDTGFQQVYAREMSDDAHDQALKARPSQSHTDTGPQASEALLNIFADTYFEDCYAWCPVLDRETIHEELTASPILQNALAALACHVRPPMLPHDSPAAHYDRARRMFYEDEEPDVLAGLKAILLFYWWAPRSPTMLHRHSSWWWTSVVIRHAQQMSIHRASQAPELNTQRSAAWRRVWWTAFARERLTALCQSKPAIINAADCNIPEPSLEDFPLEVRSQARPLVFIHWVRLCTLIGRIAQLQSRSVEASASPGMSPLGAVAEELSAWVANLPPKICINIGSRFISAFDKDAYQLHIPYLASIIVLNLRRVPESGALPLALPPAMFAASCMARLFKDILAKGDMRFLMPITAWYCGVSFIALLAASRDPALQEAAKQDLEIVTLMCDQLRKMWASAQVIYAGFDRLRATAENESQLSAHQFAMVPANPLYPDAVGPRSSADTFPVGSNLDWINYFPFATSETSRTVELLLEMRQTQDSGANAVLCDTSSLDPWDWFNGLVNAEFTLDNGLFENWAG